MRKRRVVVADWIQVWLLRKVEKCNSELETLSPRVKRRHLSAKGKVWTVNCICMSWKNCTFFFLSFLGNSSSQLTGWESGRSWGRFERDCVQTGVWRPRVISIVSESQLNRVSDSVSEILHVEWDRFVHDLYPARTRLRGRKTILMFIHLSLSAQSRRRSIWTCISYRFTPPFTYLLPSYVKLSNYLSQSIATGHRTFVVRTEKGAINPQSDVLLEWHRNVPALNC